jgi:hypothetical protein
MFNRNVTLLSPGYTALCPRRQESSNLKMSIFIIKIHSSMALQPFVVPWCLFNFVIFYADGRTPWTRDQPVARPLPKHRTTQTQNKRKQTSMPREGFEPTIPAFERSKTVDALEQSALTMKWFPFGLPVKPTKRRLTNQFYVNPAAVSIRHVPLLRVGFICLAFSPESTVET